MRSHIFLALTVVSWLAVPGYAHQHDSPAGAPMPSNLGAVSFQTSCKPVVHADFNRAVALLHSFWFEQAREVFEQVAKKDPQCAMAHWGEAMADFHPLTDPPSPDDLSAARQSLAKADAARKKSAREVAYIQALHLFYDGYVPEEYSARTKRYSDAMGALAASAPDDLEAQVFYALALLASDTPDDVELINSKKAVAILNPLLQRHPKHPGIAHYIIHACDNPHMAKEGLVAARRYASIAPAAPHALHMPSHIYARLGLWSEDIQSNLASKAAAVQPHVGAQNRLHAMEFLQYAYLQTGRYDDARAIANEAGAIQQSDVDQSFSGYYPVVQARFQSLLAIEAQDWVAAARLEPIVGGRVYSAGLTLLAHAEAAAHIHDPEAGKAAIQSIDALVAKVPSQLLLAGAPIPRLRDEIHAWAELSQGNLQGAINLLRPVADQQDKIGKEEVELPAREMLAEILLLGGRPSEALREYQASLLSDPNRFNALLGAGLAAETSGQSTLAVSYYRTLLANCAGATGAAAIRLEHAKALVNTQPR
jgi:tetratricopeptide (TPR) repeat protein